MQYNILIFTKRFQLTLSLLLSLSVSQIFYYYAYNMRYGIVEYSNIAYGTSPEILSYIWIIGFPTIALFYYLSIGIFQKIYSIE